MTRKRKRQKENDTTDKRNKLLSDELQHYTIDVHAKNQLDPNCIAVSAKDCFEPVYLPLMCQQHLICSALQFAMEYTHQVPAVEVYIENELVSSSVFVLPVSETIVLEGNVQIGLPYLHETVTLAVVLENGQDIVFSTERHLLYDELLDSGHFTEDYVFDENRTEIYLDELAYRQDIECVYLS